jgi:LysR family nitrogen assimilation transcriptional regulator
MDLNQLKVFYEVAQASGFTRAERSLGMRQPAISKAIQGLESALGLVLLERTRAGTTLTLAGQHLFGSCRTIFEEVNRLSQIAELSQKELSGDLRIATAEHVAAYLLPGPIAECGRKHPGLTPRIVTGASHLLAREIVDGRCELGLFFTIEKTALLDRMELARLPCQLVVAKGRAKDPAVLRTFIGSRELDDLSNKSFPTLRMLQQVRPDTQIRVSCNSLNAHKQMVAEGVGISILPLFMVQQELRSGQLEVLHPEYLYLATLELVTKRGRILPKPAKAFMQLVKAALRESNPSISAATVRAR